MTTQPQQQVAPQLLANLELRIGQFRQIRERGAEMDARHVVERAPLVKAEKLLKTVILQMLQAAGIESAKASTGTAYQTTRSSVSLENPDEFKRHVIGTDGWDLLDWKANKTATEDYLAINGVLPPGVKRSSIIDVNVTAPPVPRSAKAKAREIDDTGPHPDDEAALSMQAAALIHQATPTEGDSL